MPIRLLPSEVASQIAAGEVIERPASVVKELVENALDAGASQVSIAIEAAGRVLVEVGDDGGGIPATELALAVERHATSKLSSAADLFQIRTLGFRGEALASIGSVSRLAITSRLPELDRGARIVVAGGQAGAVQPAGAPAGTLVRVEDLFYNVPARLKFLKSDAAERRQIDALVTRYALAYPQVRFQLRQEGRPALQTSGDGNRRAILAALYGVDAARAMLEVIAADERLEITGFISPPSLTRSHRREMLFFVNRRPVQDAALSAALAQAYHTLLMVGRYPLAALFLEMPPEEVDVNVHPTKAEVRFRDPQRLFSAVQRAARRALLAHTPVQGLELGERRWEGLPGERGGAGAAWQVDWAMAQAEADQPQAQPQAAAPPQAAVTPLPPPILRLVGQAASAYLVAEGPDGLYLVDQHAAHERVLFEKMMAQRAASGGEALPGQALLQAAAVSLPPGSARLLEGQFDLLARLGFQVEAFGPGTFLVRSVPALLAAMEPAAALQVLVEDFEEDETPLQAQVEARIIARVCKRAAVKAGRALSAEEQRALLDDLLRCASPRTCPHGRPTMIHLSIDVLERQFGRRGAR
ncbi:MAG: DNA mismatch repair endonuclease MutL [Chloroflexi bacterium]|nr:DNA mismatch repair endonuclease MutL [Chloroflexota bacterium]